MYKYFLSLRMNGKNYKVALLPSLLVSLHRPEPFNPFYKSWAIHLNSLVSLCQVCVVLALAGVSGEVTPDTVPQSKFF